ncbi:hypothetical protein J437_LFUL003119 [Ladona fulva]|uniref:CHK kinase-like domain-containing protein n=1 Tax=Ladona fulva TaxID=123851 RepID=A0A8K0JX39_LADFU|nr:hypothetical protein J437_LFUL003119 [Ladona fulva]
MEKAAETDPNAVIYGQVPTWLNKEYFQNNLWPESKESIKAKLCMEDGKTHWVIAKCLPSNPIRQMMSEQLGTFRKEIFLYQELLPAYTQLCERMGIKGSPPWAKCLYANKDGVSDIIIMEDLKQEGYIMGDRMNGLSLEQLRLVLNSLGLYHALSLVYKNENSDNFHSKVKKQFEVPKSALEMMRSIMSGSVSAIENLVRGWGFNAEADKIASMKDTSVETLVEMIQDFDEESAVVNHGDFWINNLLFKDTPEEDRKLKILDFQMPWYTSPAMDLIYLMGSSTNTEIRRKYWKTLLEEAYLSAVRNTLKKLGHADLLK